MCKLLMMTGIKDVNNALKFINMIKPRMSKVDSHGIGYVAIDNNNKMFSEKWTNNDLFLSGDDKSQQDNELIRKFGKDFVISNNEEYKKYGKINLPNMKTFMLHTRYATCSKNIQNTHPFIINSTGLIHNGVISNSNELVNKISTCDSEVILNEYLSNNVKLNLIKLQEVVDVLEGSYAVGVATKIDNRYVVDIFKNTRSNLYVTHVNEIGSDVFCTSDLFLRETLEDLGWASNGIFEVGSGVGVRLDSQTGELISKVKLNLPSNVVTQLSKHNNYNHNTNNNIGNNMTSNYYNRR
jgi:glucosamine 6-phosphate synthetase-like amidotransferase/phosphosugar isomerase protein